MSSLRRNSLSSIASSLFVAVGAFVFNMLLAKMLGAEHRGALAFVLVIPNAVTTFANLGVRQSAAWMIGRGERPGSELEEALFSSALLLSLVAGFIGCTIMAAAGTAAYGPIMIGLGTILIVTQIFGRCVSALPLGREQIVFITMTNNTREIVRLVVLPLTVLVLGMALVGGMLAVVLAEVVVTGALFLTYILRPRVRLRFRADIFRVFVSRGIVYSTALLVFTLNYRADILIVKHYHGDAVTGIYALGVNIVETLWLIPAALGLVLFARSTTSPDVSYMTGLAGRMLRLSIVAACGMGLAVLVLARPVVDLIFGTEFAGAHRIVIFLLPGILFSLGFKILSMELAGRGRPEIALTIFTPMLFLNIVANLLVVPRWGGEGAALTSSFTYSLGSILLALRYCAASGITLRELVTYRKGDFKGLWVRSRTVKT